MRTLIWQRIRQDLKRAVNCYDFILDTHYYWRVRRHSFRQALALARKTFNY